MSDCKEEVAYKLLCNIAVAENKAAYNSSSGSPVYNNADKKWILDTYAECLKTVKGGDVNVTVTHSQPEQIYAHE
jgi:hypothetical protein